MRRELYLVLRGKISGVKYEKNKIRYRVPSKSDNAGSDLLT